MPSKLTKHVATAIIIAAAILAVAGCSAEHPLSPASSSDSDQRFDSPQTDIEFSSRVATTDPSTRTLTFTDRPEIAVAAADAEIVRKIGGTDNPIAFEDILIGDSVDVRGNPQGDGTFLANRIRVRDENSGPEVELYGRVDTIDPNARTITLVGDATLINVRLDAEVMNWDTQTPIALSDIVPTDSVEIRGYMQPDGSLEANRVRLRTGNDNDDNYDVEFKGAITSIDYAAKTLTVDGRPELILVDSLTRIYSDFGARPETSPTSGGADDHREGNMSFDQLALGDFVEVKANIVDQNTLLAVSIESEDDTDQEVEFSAVLASVDSGTRTVTFEGRSEIGTVLEGAVLRGLDNELLTLEDFSVGEIVEVRGFVSSNGDFMIDRMDKDNTL